MSDQDTRIAPFKVYELFEGMARVYNADDVESALRSLIQQWREMDSEIANRFAGQLEHLITGAEQ